jgi:sterol desaturase/sphingolipid hydroxylase (fatty acid hydroxylase superfamily)
MSQQAMVYSHVIALIQHSGDLIMSTGKTREKEQPIRLFESEFLEFFTHISPITILVIWLPVVGFFLFQSLVVVDQPFYFMPIGFLGGLFLWTFAEYILHRFLFHFPAKNEWQERLAFLFHGIHHKQPRVKTRLVMPPVVSIPLALIFFGLFYLIFNFILSIPAWVFPVFAGFIFGYVLYDMMHYSTHHVSMRMGYFRMVRQQHMHHHFQTPNQRYGVTSPLWDYVFGTMPIEK